VTITSIGYDGQVVDEVKWGGLSTFLGAPYGLADGAAWKVTAVVGLDRTSRVAPGIGYGHGVRDVSDSNVDVQHAAITSGIRWDLIVARRNWQPVGGTTTFVAVTGTATKQIPAGRLIGPGVQDDQPIALVQLTAGQSTPTAVIDLRHFTRKVTTMAADALLPTGASLGTVVCRGAQRDRLVLSTAGTEVWLTEQPLQRRFSANRTAEALFASGTWGVLAELTVEAPAGEYAINAAACVRASASSVGYLRVMAGTANLSADARRDFIGTESMTVPFVERYVHPGGSLAVSCQYLSASAGPVALTGSLVAATWLGPVLL